MNQNRNRAFFIKPRNTVLSPVTLSVRPAPLENKCFTQGTQAGFSLIEVSIGLVLLGLLSTPLFFMYGINLKREAILSTMGKQTEIIESINQFYAKGELRYPCPASVNLAPDAANFGREWAENDAAGILKECNLNTATLKLCSDLTWRSNPGVCRTDATANAVIIGAVPFGALGLDVATTEDFWGNKILYAVTAAQTDATTFSASPGAITMMFPENPNPSQNPTLPDGVPDTLLKYNSIDFFLFSTGASFRGGFSSQGRVLTGCGIPTLAYGPDLLPPIPANPANAQGFDNENCDGDAVFLVDKSPEFANVAQQASKTGAGFYDDITAYEDSVPSTQWYEHPTDISDIATSADRIGINTDFPLFAIDVNGNLQVTDDPSTSVETEGKILTPQICKLDTVNNTEKDCYDPERIAGTKHYDTMNCDPGTLATSLEKMPALRFAQSKIFCAAGKKGANTIGGGEAFVLPPIFIKVTCPTYITGFDINGVPQCAP